MDAVRLPGERRASRGRVRGIAAAREGSIRFGFPRHGKDTVSYSPANAGCPCSHIAEQDENGASVRISFSDEVLVFENEYTNMLGDVVSHRSTSTKLSCRADGGRFGGTVAVTLSDGGRLIRTQGSELPGSALVPAGDAVMLSSEYEALSESLTNDDIVATAVFTENMTGRQLTNETTLTAVRVVLTPEYCIQGFENRHEVGVGEKIFCQSCPASVSFNARAWHHTEMLGVGEWHELRNDNFFMQDYPRCAAGLPDGWCGGQITWRIPTAWGYGDENDGEYIVHEFGNPFFQVFTMNEQGLFRLAKLGHWVERLPSGARNRSANTEATSE